MVTKRKTNMNILQFINYARKFFVALAAALAILGVALVDNSVSTSEWVQIALAFLGALGVYTVANGKKETK